MADAPAMPSSPPATAVDGGPLSPSVSVRRVLPSRMLLDTPPPSSGRARGPSGSGGRGGGRGRKAALPAATSYGTGGGGGGGGGGGRRPDPLFEAVMMMPTVVDAGLASADILQLAMVKGPMFEWLSYWPEEGFRNEDHPY